MKVELFDKNGIEIQVGDKYINPNFPNNIYTVYYKGGAICGGTTFNNAEPLCWYIEDDTDDGEPYLYVDNNLNWMEIIKE